MLTVSNLQHEMIDVSVLYQIWQQAPTRVSVNILQKALWGRL